MVLAIVIDTVTNGSAAKGKIIISSIGAMLRTAVVDLDRMPDSHVFDSETGNEKVATPEADEWAGKGRDVALGAPGLHEQTPIRNQGEVEIEEQTQDRNCACPPCQWRRQVGPPDPKGTPEKQRQEQEEQQRPSNTPCRDRELCVNRVDGEGQQLEGGRQGSRQSGPPTAWWIRRHSPWLTGRGWERKAYLHTGLQHRTRP